MLPMSILRKLRCLTQNTVLLLILGAPFSLQVQAAAPVLDEIVVTARKRVENVQEVPISITVITAAALERIGATRVKDLQYAVPNLVFTGFDGNAFGPVSLRGISTEARVNGFDLALGVYVDGIYMGRSMGVNSDLVGIERVEVLRGPQGTLFGRNTTAGAINITSKKPSEEFEAEINVNVGNFNLFDVRGSMSGEIVSDRVFGRISAISKRADGYVENLFDDRTFNDADYTWWRGQLRFVARDDLIIDLSFDDLQDEHIAAFNELSGSKGDISAPGVHTVNMDSPASDNRDIWGASATIEYTLPSGLTITSLTAYRDGESLFENDNDTGPLAQSSTFFRDEMEQFTQEIRLVSPGDSRLNYVAGIFYLSQTLLTDHDLLVLEQAGIPSQNDFYGNSVFFTPGVPTIDETFGIVDVEAIAVYANVEFDLTDNVTIFGGLRYTEEDKDLVWEESGLLLTALDLRLSVIPRFEDSLSDSAISPTAGISWSLSESVNVYGKWARGFRSGGFNTDLLIPSNEISFDSETLDSFEIGFKSELFDRRVRLNAAAFYTDYSDLQVPTFENLLEGLKIGNAAEAELWGFEIEVDAAVSENTSVWGSVGYVASEFNNFVRARDPITGEPTVTYDGNRLPQAPEWTANVGAEWNKDIGTLGDLVLSLDASYRGDQYFGANNDPRDLSGDYVLVNGTIGIEKDNWRVSLWARNLLDKLYENELRFVAGFEEQWVNYGKPRSYGLRFQYEF